MRFIQSIFILIFSLSCSINLLGQYKVDSSRIVRILSFNILHGATVNNDFDLDVIANAIKATKPDLVALQEVDFMTNRAKKMDLVTELATRTKLVPLFGRAMEYDDGEYGEGILSRYSFLSTQVHPLRYEEGYEPRTALAAAVILKSGDTIQFIGTHLDHIKDERVRMQQAEDLVTIFKNTNYPAILAGDLNALPNSNPMKEIYKIWTKGDPTNQPTYPSDDPTKKIDYVLYQPANRWRVLETKVIDEKIASDHCPLLTVLELLPGR